jgi:tRNA modification GTPase
MTQNAPIYSDTIIAQCTPSGSGALAVLRISGPSAITIATALSKLANNTRLSDQQTHTVHYGAVVAEDSTVIDRVLFMLMHAPRTFTGEHVVEISCHNNPFIIEAVIQRAIACGARLAQNGEFSKRAVTHGKIDLVQAEAINELINAATQQSLKQSLAQLDGSFSRWLHTLERELLKNLAFTQASFEFLDEELEFGTRIRENLTQLAQNIATLKKTFNQQQQIRQGIRIALIGSVNAGKSSLFNALIGQRRAIVTAIAGTTRDSIEAGLYRYGTYLTLVDTAGLRTTEDIIEQEGINRSYAEAQKADLIVLVYDGSRPLSAEEQAIYETLYTQHQSKIIPVINKADIEQILQLPQMLHPISVSTANNSGITTLESTIEQKISALFNQLAAPFLLNKRHYTILLSVEQKLHTLIEHLNGTIHYELVSIHLQEILEQLTELTGKTVSEQGMDAVFREFCVGK